MYQATGLPADFDAGVPQKNALNVRIHQEHSLAQTKAAL